MHLESRLRRSRRGGALCAALGAAALLAPVRRAAAQAWFYPSFQTPRTVEREYNFAAVAAHGADLLFQWREGIAPGSQLSLDAGLADPNGPSNTKLFVGGQYALEVVRATGDQPLDLLATVGAGLAVGNGPSLFRIPVGVSVGHTFPLEGGMSVTPYVHPRVSLDFWSRSDGGDHVSLDFDVGASFVLTSALSLRGSLVFSGNDAASTGFGIGLTLTPAALRSR